MVIMTIVLKILAILICILLSLLIALIFIPFEYSLNSQIKESISFEAKVLWMFHLLKANFLKEESGLKINFFIGNKRIFSIDPTKKSNHSKKEKKHNKKSNKNNKKFFKQNFLSYAISYFKDILKIIKPKGIEIKGAYGFYDPSITGLLSGFIPIFEQIIPSSDIKLQPIFDDEFIDIKANIWGKIILFSLIYRTLKFILKKEVRKTLFKKSKTVET